MLTLSLVAVLAVAPLDVPGCKASKQEVGSLHANVSFDVGMTTPKSKLKQPLDCGGKAVTLFVSEFKSAAEVNEAANLTGPQLWGALAPTGEHDDELLLQGALQVVVSGPGVKAAADALVKKGFKPWRGSEAPADVIERVSAALDCKAGSKDPLRAWCGATLTGASGFKAAKDQTVLLGISAPLPASKDVRALLLGATRVSALAFAGGKVRLTDVTPDNKDEEKQLLEVASEVVAALKGTSPQLKISAGLAGFLPVLAGQAKDGAAAKDTAKGPTSAALKNPTRLWTVKTGKLEVFVVSEDTSDGAWLSVYPVVPAVAK